LVLAQEREFLKEGGVQVGVGGRAGSQLDMPARVVRSFVCFSCGQLRVQW
jgi:hypothetical protein